MAQRHGGETGGLIAFCPMSLHLPFRKEGDKAYSGLVALSFGNPPGQTGPAPPLLLHTRNALKAVMKRT